MKRVLGLFGVLTVLLVGLSFPASAADFTPEADYLNALGLLRGTFNGYELDRTMTRAEGAVMIVRLLGEEQAALAQDASHPFVDVPDWASPFVGYMYMKGLTQGQSENRYGADEIMTEAQYLTFLLRVLDYDDTIGDFYWAESLDMAIMVGMTNGSASEKDGRFLREGMVAHTFGCLRAGMKDGHGTLLSKLEHKGILPPTLEDAENIYTLERKRYVRRPVTYGTLVENICKMIYDLDTVESFDVGHLGDFELAQAMDDASALMDDMPIYSSVMRSNHLRRLGDELTVTLTYNNTPSEISEAKAVARAAVTELIDPKMGDYEKEMVIHDYLVNAVRYDTTSLLPPSAYTIYGALIENEAVCHGYAESFRYMAYLAGLESEIVLGEALSGSGQRIGHAWNMVTIEGETYHVDVTWDDPLMKDGSQVLSYSYFNLTDEAIAQDHFWERREYDTCSATAFNYYVYNRQVVYSKSQLKSYMQDAFDAGVEAFSVKLIGESLTTSDVKNILSQCYGYGRISYRVESNVISVESIS